MELASMLAGEPFSDHPSCACPVVSTLLRTYNDRLDDEQRQQLFPLASRVVGTRGSQATTQLRYRALAQWCTSRHSSLPRWRRWLRRTHFDLKPRTLVDLSLLTLSCLPRRREHSQFVQLVEHLLALQAPEAGQASASGQRVLIAA